MKEGYVGSGEDFDVEVFRDDVLQIKGPIAELRRFRDVVKKVRHAASDVPSILGNGVGV